MLVDYHLHLAPDGAAARRGGAVGCPRRRCTPTSARERGIDHVCLTEHCHRFRQAAGLFDHPFWNESAQADLDAYVAAVRAHGEPVGCGIELDWLEGREEEIEALVAGRDFDLVLGSVHWLGGLAVDHPDYAIWEEMAADEVWRRYFAQVRAAAASGLFDVLAHLDLAKVFGHAASQSVIDERARADGRCDRRRRRRGRDLDRRPAQGRRRAVPGAGPAARAAPPRRADHARLRRATCPRTSGATTTARSRAAHACGYRTVSVFRGRERREVPLG